MIHLMDEGLVQWVTGLREGLHVTLAPPSKEHRGTGVSLYLLDLRATPPSASGPRPPHQIILRYLVTTWAQEPLEAHELLGELAFAALESPNFEVDADLVPLEIWRSFGVSPRPAIVLRAPLRRDRPRKPVSLVREPPIVEIGPSISIAGVVVGPGGRPVAGARVELPRLSRTAHTDHAGRFRFAAVPSSDDPQEVRVSAGSRGIAIEAAAADQPLLIRIPSDSEED